MYRYFTRAQGHQSLNDKLEDQEHLSATSLINFDVPTVSQKLYPRCLASSSINKNRMVGTYLLPYSNIGF